MGVGFRWVLFASALFASATALPAVAGPGHGDAFDRTAAGTAAGFVDAPYWLAGEADFGAFVIRICAYTVTDTLGAVTGVRVITADTRGTPSFDDVFTSVQASHFGMTEENGDTVMRLVVDLPAAGGELALRLEPNSRGTAEGNWHGYEIVSFPRFGTTGKAVTLYARLDEAEASRFAFEWGQHGSGACYVTPVPMR